MSAGWLRFELLSGEWRLCLACNRWASGKSAVTFFRAISRLGDGIVWYVLMLALALFCGERGWRAALHMATVGVVAATLYRLLKRWTRRNRPYRSHAGIVALVAPLDEYSFPSGHTLHAVAFSLVAMTWFPALQVLLLPLTLLIALSRVVLGMHYPSDVIVASLIGLGLAELSIALVF